MDLIKKLNNRIETLSTANYYFSTLFKSIQHNKQKNVMRELINIYFKGGEKQLIDVTKFGATYTDKKINLRQLLIKLL